MPNDTFLSKHQPIHLKDFDIDQDFISALYTLINMGTLNILFIGNAGCGKTALINAIVRECYESAKERSINVLNINNLKEHGINYFRGEFKIFCQTCPSTIGAKKVVALDDLDMIPSQSQQVLRNCVDKYSHRVHFIGSCTNPQNVIESLQSRFIIIKIHPTTRPSMHNIFTRITTAENILFDDDAKEYLMDISNSEAKILITYLEKFKLINQKVSLKLVRDICTNIPHDKMTEYVQCLKENNLREGTAILYAIFDTGYSTMDIFDNLFAFIKISDLLTEHQKYDIIPYLCRYITYFHVIHEDEIELALFTNAVIQKLHE
jgi:DNA polymerase III delta prime subunit